MELDPGSSSSGGGRYFIVASLASLPGAILRGQSFTPNNPGPNGIGSPGAATEVRMVRFVLGFYNDTSLRAPTAYIYSAQLQGLDQIGQTANLVTRTTEFVDGSAFGQGSFTRSYYFHDPLHPRLNVDTTYYVYFDADQPANAMSPNPYSGGQSTDFNMKPMIASAQFVAEMQA